MDKALINRILSHHSIVPRIGIDFGLDEKIPRYWFEGNPFRTRFSEAVSLLLPEAEKFFIRSVRDCMGLVKDPKIKREIRNFIRQEGEHSKLHQKFNDRLKRQGIHVEKFQGIQRACINFTHRHFSRTFRLALTTAAEHLAATMAHTHFNPELMAKADPRIRALYFFHAVEEIEHKSVAFDVLQHCTKGSYWIRCLAMLIMSLAFPLLAIMGTRHMLKVDGFSFPKRLSLWLRGLYWLYRPGGVYMTATMWKHYFSYFRPTFHPWNNGDMELYQHWIETYDQTGDPIVTGTACIEEQA